MENRKHEVNVYILKTHGTHPLSAVEVKFNKYSDYDIHSVFEQYSPCIGGKCNSSRSPCVNAISHQMTANANHDSMKLNAKTNNVQRHCESTSVVNISCRNLIRLWANLDCTILQSPFLWIARRRYFFCVPGRKRLLLY